MSTPQVEIIKQYLKIETNYAVIINGPYGIGKTHFYKNLLTPEIKKISSLKDAQKKYIPVHISLFGFKSLKEVQTAIFVEIYPILKNSKLKLAANVIKSLIRGISEIKGVGDIDKYIDDLTPSSDNLLKYDQLVICFDDLDRKSESLEVKDIFGFINSLVENLGAKILIIANEEQLLEDNSYSSDLREKVIGVSIQFTPSVENVLKEIISTRYSQSDQRLYEFLVDHSGVIIDAITINKNNFRTLIFFLEHFKTIFYPLEAKFQVDCDLNVSRNEKLKAVLYFTMAVSFEYKMGFLNSTNFRNLPEKTSSFSDWEITEFLNKKENTPKTPSYFETFRSKYFSNRNYFFFRSVLDYVTGVKAFDVDILCQELSQYFVIKDGEVQEQEKILNDLGYLQCLDLGDKKYRELTRKMLKYAYAGRYQLRQYVTVFHFATRFNNLLNFNFASLKRQLKKGIDKGFANYIYNYDLSFHFSINSDSEFKEDLQEIADYCLKINDSVLEKNESHSTKDLFHLFQTNFDAFINKVSNEDSEFGYNPFWLRYDLKATCRIINKLRNQQIWTLAHYFKRRYRQNIFEKLYPEKNFVIKLRTSLDQPRKRQNKNLKNTVLNYLSETLTQCEANFPENI